MRSSPFNSLLISSFKFESKSILKSNLVISKPSRCSQAFAIPTTSFSTSSKPSQSQSSLISQSKQTLKSKSQSLNVQSRSYRHMAESRDSDNVDRKRPSPTTASASNPPGSPIKPSPTPTRPIPEATPDPDDPLNLNVSSRKTVKEQRMADWSIIKKLLQHVWPRGDGATKRRVVLALALLIGGKVSSCWGLRMWRWGGGRRETE